MSASMRGIEALLKLLFPTIRLRATPWFGLWRDHEQRTLILTSRVALPLIALGYIAHYFFVDMPLGLTESKWLFYRFGIAGLALAAWGMTWTKLGRRRFRMPLVIVGLVGSAAQALSMTWFDQVPYIYCVVIPAMVGLALQLSPFATLAYLWLALWIQSPFLSQTHMATSYFMSAMVVASIFVVFFRTKIYTDISAFVSEQEKLEAQKKLIESQMELNEEIRAFLPKEIFDRVLQSRAENRGTVLQAMDEALRPRQKTVACLFSDIRGFTQQSKDLRGFIAKSALPNIRICTELVENHHGVPRLIGDLVFAYFDVEEPEANVLHALRCGFDLVARNEEWNSEVPESQRVRRYVLVSYGEAVVGNIGGYASSREITALGTPVNILSRIDPLTKHPKLISLINPSSLVLTDSAAEAARQSFPRLELEPIDLYALGIQVRDFPEERTLWCVPASSRNRHLIERHPEVSGEYKVPAAFRRNDDGHAKREAV